jgi:hypothetical protein
MQSADFNSDGKIDIAVSLSGDDQIAVLFGNGNGSFSSPIKYQIIGDQPNSMKCADINNDGKIDIITGQIVSRDINIFLNDGSGNFLSPIVALSGIFIDNVVLEAVDFIDNDGNKDILLITIGGSCAAFYGDGNGGFLNGSGVNTGPSLGSSKFIADFNGDGLKDIGGSEIPGTTLMIILGDTGTANFSNYQSLTYQCSIQPIDLLSVDLNADNRPDLIAADNFSQNIVVFINTTPVNIFEIESDSKLQIPFPNPVTNILHFKNDGHIVELCNFLGQKITTTTKEYIEMGSLKTGYYILKTNNDSMIIEKK